MIANVAQTQVILIVVGESTATTWYRAADFFDSTSLILSDLPSARERLRERLLKSQIQDLLDDVRDYKAKAILRRREHAAFVGLIGGPAPVPRDRVHSRQRRPAKHDAWRPRALKRYRPVSTRVRGSVPPGR